MSSAAKLVYFFLLILFIPSIGMSETIIGVLNQQRAKDGLPLLKETILQQYSGSDPVGISNALNSWTQACSYNTGLLNSECKAGRSASCSCNSTTDPCRFINRMIEGCEAITQSIQTQLRGAYTLMQLNAMRNQMAPQPSYTPMATPSYQSSGSASCQNNCTQRWISCDKACEAAPNYGFDPQFNNRNSICHSQCQSSYSVCKQGC